MKLWRELAMKEGKKDGRRPGRSIKNGLQMQEYMFRDAIKTYPLLNALFARVGIVTPEKKVETNEAN